jgi:hypothetical protein
MNKLVLVTTLVLITTLTVTGCEKKEEEKPAPGEKIGVVPERAPKEASGKPTTAGPSAEHPTVRLLHVREKGIIKEYTGLSNPLDATGENIKKGGEIFRTRCSMCHGEKGFGDVPAGRLLMPPASNIAVMAGLPEASDAYLFWTISEGGMKLRTQMPSFKGTLSEEDIWRVILYVRAELKIEEE